MISSKLHKSTHDFYNVSHLRALRVLRNAQSSAGAAVFNIISLTQYMCLPENDAAQTLCSAGAIINPSQDAYTQETAFALRAIAADFPRFELGDKVPRSDGTPIRKTFSVSFNFRSGPNRGKKKHEVIFDEIDYGISFAPFCVQEFLPSQSAEDHTMLMETAAICENFRCFFLHLGVELGVHPFALQHVCRERCAVLSQLIDERNAADQDTDCQFFFDSVNSVLKRSSTYNR
jgi:hypothetical protein